MKKPKGGKREVVVSQAEFDDILSLAKDDGFRDLLIVSWETGCRPQESLIVEAQHVDLVNQRWVFQQSEEKCGESLRVVYLTDRALAIVKRLMVVLSSRTALPQFGRRRVGCEQCELRLLPCSGSDGPATAWPDGEDEGQAPEDGLRG